MVSAWSAKLLDLGTSKCLPDLDQTSPTEVFNCAPAIIYQRTYFQNCGNGDPKVRRCDNIRYQARSSGPRTSRDPYRAEPISYNCKTDGC